MKKLLLLISAVICMVCAYAQSVANPLVSYITFNVPGQIPAEDEDGDPIEGTYTVGSVDSMVDITFVGYDSALAEELGLTPYLMTLSGMGYGVDPEVEPLVPVNDMAEKELGDAWGNPYLGSYYVNLIVCFMDEAGDFYMVNHEPLIYQIVYTTPNVFPAKLSSYYPNNNWEEESFAEAYERGTITFSFTNPVDFKDASDVATIVYTMDGAPYPETVAKSACEIGWNSLDGYYAVTFTYASEDYPVEDLSKVSITLNGVTSTLAEGEPVDVKVSTVVLDNDVAAPAMRQKKSRIANELVESNELMNVYNIHGMLVKEGVNKDSVKELPAGLYIVDGKKVIVR